MEENMNTSKVIDEIKGASEEELKKIINEHFDIVRTRSMKMGATYIAMAISGVIEKNLKDGMNSSHRDFKRAMKRIIEIISVQLSQEETLQNDFDESAEEVANDE